jgi:hypothetical protein
MMSTYYYALEDIPLETLKVNISNSSYDIELIQTQDDCFLRLKNSGEDGYDHVHLSCHGYMVSGGARYGGNRGDVAEFMLQEAFGDIIVLDEWDYEDWRNSDQEEIFFVNGIEVSEQKYREHHEHMDKVHSKFFEKEPNEVEVELEQFGEQLNDFQQSGVA